MTSLVNNQPHVIFVPFLHNQPKNKAEAFEKWSQDVENNNPFTKGNIDIVDKSKVRSFEDYKAELEKFSNDYIQMMDNDNDGKVTYDEFEAFHINNRKFQSNNVLGYIQELKAYKEALHTAYDRINVDKENDSKDNIDAREIANYFAIMDSANLRHKINGNISQKEFERMSELVQSKGLAGEYIEDVLERSFEKHFKNDVQETDKKPVNKLDIPTTIYLK